MNNTERLTERKSKYYVMVKGYGIRYEPNYRPVDRAVCRLADYEDTGLTPKEEILEMKAEWRYLNKDRVVQP